MKRILILILTICAAGCSSGKNTTSSGAVTALPGTWAVTGTISGDTASHAYQVVLVSSPCSVTTPVGTFSVQGPVCFIANNNSGQGSITGPGVSTTGVGVLLGVAANPVPDGSAFNLLFVTGSQGGMFAEFTGSGTVTGGTFTGTGACGASTPICQGVTSNFSGKLQ